MSIDDMKARHERIRASLGEHLARSGTPGDAGITVALEWLDYLARWDVDAAFPFPADSFGNPTTDAEAWVDWSAASGVRETLEAAAAILRGVSA